MYYYNPGMKIGTFFDKLAGAKPAQRLQPSNNNAARPHAPHASKIHTWTITPVVLTALLLVASFYLGTVYQSSRQSAVAAFNAKGGSSTQSQNGWSGYGQNPVNGGFGGSGRHGRASASTSQVTAISASSITVKDSSGGTQTYGITDETNISDDQQTVSASDIKVGDNVMVIPNRSEPNVARLIIVNPNFGNQNSQQSVDIDPSETQLN